MPNIVVFDIETYRPDWRIRRTRREDFDPARNTIITTGVFDGKEISISPVIEDLKEERKSLEFFLKTLKEFQAVTLVGYNILHFDTPYLVYKSKPIEEYLSMARCQLLDLFWVLPYWLHNTSNGRKFHEKVSGLGELWKFEYVVEHILGEEPNPFSNKDVLELWEKERFADIRRHLELDLVHTLSFYRSSVIQEALNDLKKQSFKKNLCQDDCPYRQPLQQTPETVFYYCTLLRETTSDEKALSAIDAVDYPLPRWGASWVPHCLE